MRYCSDSYRALEEIAVRKGVSADRLLDMMATASIIPFKTNRYIVDNLIDWANAQTDPIFQVNFPQKELLDERNTAAVRQLIASNAPSKTIMSVCESIRNQMIVQSSSGRAGHGVPVMNNRPAVGVFHNFPHTIFLFPHVMSACFANCNYCLRWGNRFDEQQKFTYRDPLYPVDYIAAQTNVTDIIFSGGDALNVSAKQLHRYIRPLLDIAHIDTIRLSTRAFSWWPDRFVNDADAEDLLRLMDEIVAKDKHVAVMTHLIHSRELMSRTVEKAVSRVRNTGAVIRAQGPILKNVNDTPETLADLWRRQVKMGIVPYYLFLESQKGLKPIYKLNVIDALSVYKGAHQLLGGLAKTVRGPVFNTSSMKVQIEDVVHLNGNSEVVLKCIQSENPKENGRAAIVSAQEAINADDMSVVFREHLGQRLKPQQ